MTPNKSKVSIPAFSGQITKILIVSLIVGIVFSIWINTVFDSKHDEIAQKDYTSYLTGAYMVRKGAGQLLYDVSAQISYQTRLRALPDDIKSQPLPFKTPPFVSLIFLPFTGLPLVAGYKLFSLLNMTILVFIVWLINAKTIKKRGSVYLYLLAFLFFPSISLLIRGQVSLYLFLVIIGVYFSLRENLSLKAGAISGLILIKPQYLLLIPPFFLIAKNKGRFLKGYTLSTAILFFVSVAISGFGALILYPSFLLATEVPFFGSHPEHMFSLSPLIKAGVSRFGLADNISLPINFLLYAVFIYLFSRQTKSLGRDMLFIIATVASTAFAIHIVDHDLIIFLLPIYLLLAKAKEPSNKNSTIKKGYAIFLATALFLIPYLYIFDMGPLAAVFFLALSLYFLLAKGPYRVDVSENTDLA